MPALSHQYISYCLSEGDILEAHMGNTAMVMFSGLM